MRFWLTVAGLLCAHGFSGTATSQSVDATPELTIEVQPTHLQVDGVVSSIAHDAILRETAARLFTGRTAEFTVEIQVALPPGWALITDLTLQSLASTRTSTATIRASGITIRGLTTDHDRWARAEKRIERVLPEGWTLHHQVEGITAPTSIHRQCINLFRTAMRGRKIEFEHASTTLGTATTPLLDELIQIITDCPDALVDITGHTDSTGVENVNLALSQARADAVAGYLVAGGITADRIHATGVGSAEPLTEENSPQARKLNRRIEVSLRFP